MSWFSGGREKGRHGLHHRREGIWGPRLGVLLTRALGEGQRSSVSGPGRPCNLLTHADHGRENLATTAMGKLPFHSEDKLSEAEITAYAHSILSVSLRLVSLCPYLFLSLCVSACCISLHILSHFTFWLGIERLLVLHKLIYLTKPFRDTGSQFWAPPGHVRPLVGKGLTGPSRFGLQLHPQETSTCL